MGKQLNRLALLSIAFLLCFSLLSTAMAYTVAFSYEGWEIKNLPSANSTTISSSQMVRVRHTQERDKPLRSSRFTGHNWVWLARLLAVLLKIAFCGTFQLPYPDVDQGRLLGSYNSDFGGCASDCRRPLYSQKLHPWLEAGFWICIGRLAHFLWFRRNFLHLHYHSNYLFCSYCNAFYI